MKVDDTNLLNFPSDLREDKTEKSIISDISKKRYQNLADGIK